MGEPAVQPCAGTDTPDQLGIASAGGRGGCGGRGGAEPVCPAVARSQPVGSLERPEPFLAETRTS